MIKHPILMASLCALGAAANTSAYAFMGDYINRDNSSTYCKPGFYAGVQGGRSDTFYNAGNVLAQAASNENFLANPYTVVTTTAGGQTITTTLSNQSYGGLISTKVDDIGIGGRVFAGYQFNPGFAMEMGYTQYGKTDFSATGKHTNNVTVDGDSLNITSFDKYKGNVTEHAVDLVGKATLPTSYGLGLYAKAGLAYITATRSINAVYNTSTIINNSSDKTVITATPGAGSSGTLYTKTYQAFRPTYGAGIDYTFPHSNIDMDISWTRVQGSGGIPNADLAAVGLNYKFA